MASQQSDVMHTLTLPGRPQTSGTFMTQGSDEGRDRDSPVSPSWTDDEGDGDWDSAGPTTDGSDEAIERVQLRAPGGRRATAPIAGGTASSQATLQFPMQVDWREWCHL